MGVNILFLEPNRKFRNILLLLWLLDENDAEADAAAAAAAAPPMLACMTTWKGKAYGHACSVVWLAPLDGLTDVDLREQDLSDRRPA